LSILAGVVATFVITKAPVRAKRAMSETSQTLAKESFRFRFSDRKPRDIQLSHWIAEDVDNGRVNVSEVIKELLYAWYIRRHSEDGSLLPPGMPAMGLAEMEAPEEVEDPDDPLVQRFVNLSFDNM
jgi:hypothetical protein